MVAAMRMALFLVGILWGAPILPQLPTAAGSGLGANLPEAAETTRGEMRLPKGTVVRLMSTETISSKKAKPGDTCKFQVHGNVKVDDLVVIANKTIVLATVLDAQSAGMAWHSGSLIVRLGSVKLVDHQNLQLESSDALKGAPTHAVKAWAERVAMLHAYGLMALPFSPLQHGNEAVFPKTSIVDAVTASDALLDRGDIEAAQPPVLGKNHNGDMVVIYFMPHYWGSVSPEIWCGSVKIGVLDSGRKMNLTLPPGKYFFYLNGKGIPLSLQAVDGGEHYFKLARQVLPEGKTSWLSMKRIMMWENWKRPTRSRLRQRKHQTSPS